jgi:hypothetical protein
MARTLFSRLWRYVTSTQVDSAIWDRTKDVFSKNWHLGFTAFGGPPVHFQIVSMLQSETQYLEEYIPDTAQLHKKFVERHKWIDEQLVSNSPCLKCSR